MLSILMPPPTENGATTNPENRSKQWVSLLQSYLESGSCYFDMSPVNEVGILQEDGSEDEDGDVVNMLHLGPDDWVNSTHVENLRKKSLDSLREGNNIDIASDQMEVNVHDTAGVAVDSESKAMGKSSFAGHDRVKAVTTELSQRTRSIKAKLHTLLKALQSKIELSSLSSFPLTQSMVQVRELRAEKLLLNDLLAKYKAEIINLQAEVKLRERRLSLKDRAMNFNSTGNAPVGGNAALGTSGDDVTEHFSNIKNSFLPTEAVPSTREMESGENLENKESANCDSATSTVSSALLQKHQVLEGELEEARQKEAGMISVMETLQQQLAESEALRCAADEALMMYIYHTVSSSGEGNDEIPEKLSSNLRTEMEKRWSREAQELVKCRQQLSEVRQQAFKRIEDLEIEKNQYCRRLSELELAMSVLTKSSDSRIASVTELTASQIESIRAEKEEAKSALHAIQQDLVTFEKTKSCLKEAEEVGNSTKRQCVQLSDRIKSLNTTIQLLEKNLEQSRCRESELTAALAAAEMNTEQKIRALALEAGMKDLQNEAEEGMITEEGNVDIAKYDTVRNAQEECHKALTSLVAKSESRIRDLTIELSDCKDNLNDLILEIEGVANEEERTREHNSLLVKQLKEAISDQKEVKMENLRLHQEIQELSDNIVNIKQENERLNIFSGQQVENMELLRQTEQNLQAEVHQLTCSLVDANTNGESKARALIECEDKCKQTEIESAECRRKLSDMKVRYNELSKRYESERRKGLDNERQLKSAQAKNVRLKCSHEDAVTETGDTCAKRSESEGNEMLDLTLNMLRCSVCRDRFKEVAITRCFHLFCRQCIDLNLSSRHRKCPACGERFGQDDVKTVYFVH